MSISQCGRNNVEAVFRELRNWPATVIGQHHAVVKQWGSIMRIKIIAVLTFRLLIAGAAIAAA
jgi:hypothetical protein